MENNIFDNDTYLSIIEAHKELTASGFGMYPLYKDQFEEERKILPYFYGAYKVCVLYLLTQRPVKKIESNFMKRRVELWADEHNLWPRYIPEGVFIIAVLALELPYKRIKGTPSIIMK